MCARGAGRRCGKWWVKFLAGLANRKDEVRRRCRTVLQSRAEALQPASRPDSQRQTNAHPSLALV